MRGGAAGAVSTVAFHIDQLFFRVPGGIGTYIRELVPALAAADPSLEITLFHARFVSGERPEAWMHAFARRELRRSIRRLYPTWDLLGRPSLPRELGSLDLLHAPTPAAIPPPGRDQRLVATVHDLAFHAHPKLFPTAWRTLYRLGTRRAARRADAIIVPSQSTARDLVRHHRPSLDRVHVVPLAASLPQAAADPEETLRRLKVSRPYLLFVGTLEPRKNVVRLLRAYRRAVARSGLPHALVLAGPLGWGSERLHRELAVPGPGQVIPTGRTEPRDVDALYRAADAFVYPSLYEGFGLPVLEAMARGTPVITSGASSIPEVVGDAALTVDPRSVSDLAAAIERLLTDPPERRRLSAAGRARAEGFSWERTARLTLKVYESLLG